MNISDKLARDPEFYMHDITKKDIEKIMYDKNHFIGNARSQMKRVFNKADELLIRYQDEARYEPGEIL